MPDLSLEAVRVSFPGLAAPALDIPALHVAAGTRMAVTGPSGAGKTTLINLIVGLARPDSGRIAWGETDLARLGEAGRDRFRAAHVGLVMQNFHLFPGLSALENVLLPARFWRPRLDPALRARGLSLLERVGVRRPRQKVETLSRGEMQRVAVARAALMSPGVLVADEPTASLDADAGTAVAELLCELAKEQSATLIVVTHDARLVARMARHLTLVDGRIVADVPVVRAHGGAEAAE
ncbi:ABC transporter ATP-binding protein [Roseixanthobacter glucoisosaccharinicivorans]|uniref:ABC transporter ATP-binding protein n=1 Tax=Roseixanthobacter glucoisosaccharinicivorans TaxID=3119923 RepID=UPI00372B73C6